MDKVRVGVIGAGSWTVASHLPSLMAHSGQVELVGVCRRGPEQLAKIKSEYGFQVASEDYRDVLDAGVDVCVVGSPAGFHHEHAKAAMEAGAHVLCEKPVTIEPSDAWDLVRVAETTGRHFIANFGWNYSPFVTRAKELIDQSALGQLEHMTVHMSSQTRELLSNRGAYPGSAPDVPPDSSTWTDRELSGGGYGQAQLSHALGLACWVTGARAASGFALMSSPLSAPVELHDAIAYTFDGGAVGVVSGGSAHLGAGSNRDALEVRAIGGEGQFLLDVERPALWLFSRGREQRFELSSEEVAYGSSGAIDALVAAGAGEAFVNQSPVELAARTVEALDIAYRSAASGRLEYRADLAGPTTEGR